jgi:RHS repeat-associated protein
VTDASNTLIAAYDYDAWGYAFPERVWSEESAKYKFTGKERDNESGYDYFGARYYDSRIGRWGATDPLFEKHINYTPYNYVLDNQLRLIDPDGKQIDFTQKVISATMDFVTSFNSRDSRYEAEKSFRDDPDRVAEYGPQPGNIDETVQPQDVILIAGSIGKVGVKTLVENGFLNFGKNSVKSLGEIFENPSLIKGMKVEEVEKLALKETKYEITTLTQGGKKGGSFKVLEKTETGYGNKMIMRHPGGGHHGPSPYWKVSSAKLGTERLFDYGKGF